MPLLVLATLVALPFQFVFMGFWKAGSRRAALLWHRLALRILGIRVRLQGRVPARRPLLIVANHVSWSDIVVLGSAMELCFVAKAEVRAWPGINLLARLQRTVFIDRARRRQSAAQASTIAARLLEEDAMVLFAEGTTGDGHRVLPFKSALFGSVHAALQESDLSQITVQPVAIAYTRLHGLPLGRFHQSRVAWPGEVSLLPHLIGLLLDGAYDAEIAFCEPDQFGPETSRKVIARATRESIRIAHRALTRPREPTLDPPPPGAYNARPKGKSPNDDDRQSD